MTTTALQCPQCHQTETLTITLTATANLAADGTVADYILAPSWDANSPIHCRNCLLDGPAHDFTA